ncbi:Uncharacterised protein [Candidatus Venteria ishoeyi]|uniref:Uncharacterized protein n=2 Tax=Candidatus Venteria ishoeyi TaxID=1899563 RepID=A0A1H6F5R7_9GAMM|nr:Uncharacterised protein [Candidatus Venteria ishoeyi]
MTLQDVKTGNGMKFIMKEIFTDATAAHMDLFLQAALLYSILFCLLAILYWSLWPGFRFKQWLGDLKSLLNQIEPGLLRNQPDFKALDQSFSKYPLLQPLWQRYQTRWLFLKHQSPAHYVSPESAALFFNTGALLNIYSTKKRSIPQTAKMFSSLGLVSGLFIWGGALWFFADFFPEKMSFNEALIILAPLLWMPMMAGLIASAWWLLQFYFVKRHLSQFLQALSLRLDQRIPVADSALRLSETLANTLDNSLSQHLVSMGLFANALKEGLQEEFSSQQEKFSTFVNTSVQQNQAELEKLTILQQQQFAKLLTEFKKTVTERQTESPQAQVVQESLDAASKSIHDFVQMLGYLNKIIPEAMDNSAQQLEVRFQQIASDWQAQLLTPTASLAQAGTELSQKIHEAGTDLSGQFEKIQQGLQHSLQQIQDVSETLSTSGGQITQMTPTIEQHLSHLEQSLPMLQAPLQSSQALLQNLQPIMQNLESFSETQQNSLQQFATGVQSFQSLFDRQQKYVSGITENMVETTKNLTYVASELQHRTDQVQQAILESTENIQRLERMLAPKQESETEYA